MEQTFFDPSRLYQTDSDAARSHNRAAPCLQQRDLQEFLSISQHPRNFVNYLLLVGEVQRFERTREREGERMRMGSEANSSSSAAVSSSPSGKRSRDPEDEVYLDNLKSHKRYLSEIMASSLNGLTVGDPLPDNLMESPATSDTLFYLSNGFRDDISLQYSPMSEDSDDARYCETPTNTCSSQPESLPTSPVSPYRYQRPPSGFSSASHITLSPSHCTSFPTVSSSQTRHRDSEGRFPSSPSDICHSADLRRAALLRSVQMRTHPSGSSSVESPFSSGPESLHTMETEDRPSSYMKSLVDDRDYQIEEISSFNISDSEYNPEKPCGVVNISTKTDKPEDKVV